MFVVVNIIGVGSSPRDLFCGISEVGNLVRSVSSKIKLFVKKALLDITYVMRVAKKNKSDRLVCVIEVIHCIAFSSVSEDV